MTAPSAFDVGGELPRRTTVLEASAGTGKTYTIAALVARYLAEGHAELGELMIVTFGRMATDELRVRVRERLVSLEHALTGALEGRQAPAEADPVNKLLATGEVTELVLRRDRIRRALSDFDAATIATTHEFCQRMLDGLGVLGNREPDAVFSEWLGDLTSEVSRDVYLRRYAAAGDAPFSFEDASRLASTVVDSPHTRLVPSPPPSAPDGAESEEPAWVRQVDFAEEVRAEVQRRKQRSRVFSYDDMLTRLRDALADPHTGEAAARRLRQRYRIVLVDEFQDTDVIQWEILRRAFHGHSDLILIGDPKQAIYAFRGADVYSYLDAVEQADQVKTLEQNWRSDRALTEALEQLAGSASLGHEDIVVRPVRSFHVERRIGSADHACRARSRRRADHARSFPAPGRSAARGRPASGPGGGTASGDPARSGRRRDRTAGRTAQRSESRPGRGGDRPFDRLSIRTLAGLQAFGRCARRTSRSWSERTREASRSATP